MSKILDRSYYNGPQCFSMKRLSKEQDLFISRAALFYTPTSRLPLNLIGSGTLDVTLPISSPTLYDCYENMAFRIPRLWVELLQRATFKLRWTPIVPAKVTFIRADYAKYGDLEIVAGAKAVLDALKYKTSGRTDRKYLYYFGAILNDNSSCLSEYRVEQIVIDNPADASLRIIVENADPRT